MIRVSNRFLLPLACVLALAACQPKADTTADKAAIQAASESWLTAYNAKNAEAVAALYSDDAQVFPPGSPAIGGKAAILDFFTKDIAAQWAKISTASDASDVAGDWGWRSGAWSIEGPPAMSGKYIEVWHRTPAGWKLHRDIWNMDAMPPPAAAEAAAAPATAQ
jgi:ketosteroid isomerase-like protein